MAPASRLKFGLWPFEIIHGQGRGVESFADDLVTGQGVVFSRAATILRSVETKPLIGRFEVFGSFHYAVFRAVFRTWSIFCSAAAPDSKRKG